MVGGAADDDAAAACVRGWWALVGCGFTTDQTINVRPATMGNPTATHSHVSSSGTSFNATQVTLHRVAPAHDWLITYDTNDPLLFGLRKSP